MLHSSDTDTSQSIEEKGEAEAGIGSALAPTAEGDSGITGPQHDKLSESEDKSPPQDQEEKLYEDNGHSEKPEAPEDKEEPEEEFEEFEITLGEDSPISEEKFGEIMDFIEAKGFNEEEAKSFIKMQEDAFTLGSGSLEAQRAAESKANRDALVNDPEFGGSEEKFAESVKIMAKPVEAFGDESFSELLRSDIGNNPALGRFLFKLGKAMESEGFHGKAARESAPKKSISETLYPSFYEKA